MKNIILLFLLICFSSCTKTKVEKAEKEEPKPKNDLEFVSYNSNGTLLYAWSEDEKLYYTYQLCDKWNAQEGELITKSQYVKID